MAALLRCALLAAHLDVGALCRGCLAGILSMESDAALNLAARDMLCGREHLHVHQAAHTHIVRKGMGL